MASSRHPPLLYLSIFLSAVGGFLFGYDTGVIAGAMPLVEKDRDFWPEDKDVAILWLALITTMTVLFAFLFTFVGGFVTEKWGRKPAILLASLIFTAGSAVMAAAGNKEVLLFGRTVVGMGIGIASMCVPVYMAETSPVEMRGFLGASFQVMICLGQVVAAVVDALFEKVEDGWKWDFGLAAIPSVILLGGFLLCPESPRWLVQQGKKEAAMDVLTRMRRPDKQAVLQELEEILNIVAEDEKIKALTNKSPLRRAWGDPSVMKSLLVGCSLQLFQQLIGINTVIYYSARILMMSGISNDMGIILWLSAAVSAVNFLASFLGMAMIDRVGRRLLSLFSYVGILISLVVIGVGFQVSEANTTAVTLATGGSGLEAEQCRAFNDCNSCTDEYDDFDCGFCYLEDSDSTNGQNEASCVPWLVPTGQDDAQASMGRCAPNATEYNKEAIFVAEYCNTRYSPIIMVGLIAYLVSFQAGVGPVPWVYNSEIYPLWFRSTGVSISTGFNWFLNILVAFTFPYLQKGLGFGAYYLFAGMAVVAIAWFWLVLVESKGRTLEEMSSLFSRPLWRLGRPD